MIWLNADGTVAYAPDFESKEISAGTDYLDFNQPECGEYKYEIYQEDLAENPTGVKTKKVRHNFPPVVTLTVSNMTTYQGHTLIFAATASDPDGTVDKYYWYLDSNLISEIETSTTILDHTFADIGKYEFEVVVEDNDGQKSAILDEDNPDSILTVTITNTLIGELLVDEVWSQENLPIWTNENVMKLTGTVIVPEAITLEIDPGIVISLPANSSLQVYGSIKLVGELINPITLTGTDWNGVEIYQTGFDQGISHIIFENAIRGLTLIDQTTMITNSIFRNNEVGLHLYQSEVIIKDSQFDKNNYFGIKEDEGSNCVILDSIFMNDGLSPYYDEERNWLDVDELNSLNTGNIQQ